MRSYLIILCLVLLIFPANAAGVIPTVTGLTPGNGFNSTIVSITNLAGANFASGSSVILTPVAATQAHKSSLADGAGGSSISNPLSVDVKGNYAYITSTLSSTLEIVDISNPAAPSHKSKIVLGSVSYKPTDIFVSGNYAYMTIGEAHALEIVNVANPANPVHTGSLINGPGNILFTPKSVFVSGTYAYIATSDNGGIGALEIVNVANPASPVHTGSIRDGSGGALLNGASSVYVSGNYAYVASYDGNALEIVDISNPANPVHAGSIADGVGGALLYNPASVYVSGNYAYVASYNSNALEIVDISNPANPNPVGNITNGNGALLWGPMSVQVSGNYAYVVSENSNALEIIDVSNPASPVHKSSISNGAGGALLFLPVHLSVSGSYAYVVGFSNALEIVDIDAITATGVSVGSPNLITCTVNLTGKSPGLYNVIVTNPDGNFGTLASGFSIVDQSIMNRDKIGILRNSNGNWYLDFNNLGVVDKTFHFGTTGDTPVVGDWNGDGTSDMGVFRPSGGNWFINYYQDAVSDRSFHFGTTGDIPVVGDWDGNGIDDIGVFRPSNGNWYLDTTKTGVVNKTFHFGTTGDIPVVGDWDGNGIDDIGVFRPSNGNWYLDTTKTGVVTTFLHFGKTGDIPVVGNWRGIGTSDIGVFRPSNGNWFLDTTKTGVVNKTFHFGTNGDIPIVGDWRGIGTTDIGVFRPANGGWFLDTTKTGVVATSFHFGTTGDSPKIGKWIIVNPNPVAPTAAFTANVLSGPAPLTVQFTDQSTTNVRLTYAWDFGDNLTSISPSPSHQYTNLGSYTVRLTVTNGAGGNTVIKNGYITVNQRQPITLSPASPLPAGIVTHAYSQTITASGGTAPYTYTVSSGVLPTGLSLSTGGVISGTPTVANTFTFNITATDANSITETQGYSLTINPASTITLSPASPLPTGIVTHVYSQTIIASGGTGPYTFTFTSGALPTGLTLSSGGVISGTPTVANTFTFNITATDANSFSGTKSYSLTINPVPTITLSPVSPLPEGNVTEAYSQTITASGGTGPYTFAFTSGALPTGLTLSTGGIISGTPTVANTFTFNITATDDDDFTGTRSYSLTVNT